MTTPSQSQKLARSFEDMKGGLDLLIGGLHDLKATIEQLETETLNWADSKVDHVWPQVDNMPEEEEERPAVETEPTVSMEDARKALAQLAANGTEGKKRLRKILNTIGAKRFSDVTPDQYSQIVEMAGHAA